MSMRTKMPRAAASATTVASSDRHRSRSTLSPSAVSFTDTLASRRSPAIASRTAWYAAATASAAAGCVTSSPRTSTVASFPSAFNPATVLRASSSVAPAMYGADRRWTTGRGTAGSRRTMARSTTLTPARFYEGIRLLPRGVSTGA
jgi:hypothetical protein